MAVRRSVTLVLLALLGVLVVGGVGWGLLLVTWGGEYDARVEALRARGVPILPADLRVPAPAPEDNGAALLDAWWQWWKGLGDAPDEWALRLQEVEEGWLDEAALDEARRILREAGEPHALLGRAVARPVVHEELAWSAGIGMRIESIPRTADLCAYLELRAALLDGEAALEGARLLLRLSVAQDLPFVLGECVEINVQHVACDLLRDSAMAPGFDAEAARADLDPLLVAARDRVDRLEAWGDEGTLARWVVEAWRGRLPDGSTGAEEDLSFDEGFGAWWMRPWMLRAGLRTLDLLARGEQVLRLPPAERLGAARRVQEGLDKYSLAEALARLHAPVLSNLVEEDLRHRARIAVARVGLALLAHAERTGAYPDSLDALGPMFPDGVPADPLTGGPLTYARGPEGGARVEATAPGEVDPDDPLAWPLTAVY